MSVRKTHYTFHCWLCMSENVSKRKCYRVSISSPWVARVGLTSSLCDKRSLGVTAFPFNSQCTYCHHHRLAVNTFTSYGTLGQQGLWSAGTNSNSRTHVHLASTSSTSPHFFLGPNFIFEDKLLIPLPAPPPPPRILVQLLPNVVLSLHVHVYRFSLHSRLLWRVWDEKDEGRRGKKIREKRLWPRGEVDWTR